MLDSRGKFTILESRARFHTSSRVSIKVSLDFGRIVRICIYIFSKLKDKMKFYTALLQNSYIFFIIFQLSNRLNE